MFIRRDLQPFLVYYAEKFPVIAVIGPRQAGKTTLVRETFAHHVYFSLENPDTLDLIRSDPRSFLEKNYNASGIILDEFQNLGYATEAVMALIKWGFQHPSVQMITAETFPSLYPSIRVMEKCGLSFMGAGSEEGTLRYGKQKNT